MRPSLRRLIPRRRWARVALIVLLMLGVLWIVAPRLAAPYVQAKLQAMIASKLSAKLEMDHLAYLPPFGVRVRNARLIALDDAGGEFDLLKIARLDLRLAKLPFGEGPLVIKRIDVQEPELHLVLTERGMLGSTAFQMPPGVQTRPSHGAHLPPGTKLSDMFELRHFALWGGRVVLEDRTRRGSVPMVWSELNLSSEINPTSRSGYTFDLKADHKNVAAMSAAGAFDLDALHVSLAKADLDVRADPNANTSGVPAPVQSILQTNHIAGKLGIHAAAELPLKDMAAATFDVTLRVTDGSARFPQLDTPLDRLNVAVRCETLTGPATPHPIRVRVEQFEAAGRDLGLTFATPRPSLLIDRAAKTWTLSDVAAELNLGTAESQDPLGLAGRVKVVASASGPLKPPAGQTVFQAADYRAIARPVGVRVQPPKFPLPLENVGGDDAQIELKPGVVILKHVAARYGSDDILVRTARIPIPAHPRELKESFAVEEIDGHVVFQRPNSVYPEKFNKVVERLRPAGAFEVGGGSHVRVYRVPTTNHRKTDWFFSVSADDASLVVTDKDIELAHITGDATASNLLVDITRFQCKLFNGDANFTGKIVPKKPYPVNAGRVSLREVDLSHLARALRPEHPSGKLSGRGFLNMTFAGSFGHVADVSPADALHGAGEFEVIDGDFWTLPVLGKVASQANKRNNALTLGEAAGVFRIADRNVQLENAAVNSPALGLIGSGTVGFDKSLDLRIVAAPLGDWRDNIKRTRIPILSDVTAEVVGGVQRILNAATSTLLYQFHVTGTMGDPNVQTVPAPVLTEPAALLLGRMLQEKPQQKLIESVRPEHGK